MGFGLIELDCFGMELLLLMLEFLFFCHGHVVHHLRVEPQFLFGFVELLELFAEKARIDLAELEFSKHFFHFLDFIRKFLLLRFQCSYQLISFALINNSFVLNFLSLIGVPQSRQCLLMII